MNWRVTYEAKPKLNKPILIEGLPGIANVGKIAADFLIDETKAKKLCSLFSYTLPHSVFVNEDNLVELPIIEMYYTKGDKNDIIYLVGDIQPMDEVSCYEFCETILNIMEEFDGTDIITLGGIGLQNAPKTPKVYCTGNSKKIIERYTTGTKVDTKLYGVVGPIVGVSGVLLGMAGQRKREAIALLAETFGHPMYLGIKGAREILKVLMKKLSLKIDLSKLEDEIKDLETDMKKSDDLSQVKRSTAIKKAGKYETNYIG